MLSFPSPPHPPPAFWIEVRSCSEGFPRCLISFGFIRLGGSSHPLIHLLSLPPFLSPLNTSLVTSDSTNIASTLGNEVLSLEVGGFGGDWGDWGDGGGWLGF